MKLAVIPARAGSTRLKNKNIYPLLGKPLIRWITEAVIDSHCFDKVMISTDSDQIFDAVSDLRVVRHTRNQKYANSQVTVVEALIDLMQNMEEKYDIFAYFLPTCPFISPDDIRDGVKKIDSDDCDTVISMTLIQETIQLACLIKNDEIVPIYDNIECGMTNSKMIKKYYKPSGAFYMGKWDHILETKNFFKGKAKSVVIPTDRSIDINTIMDIKYAETVYDHMRIEKDE